MIACSVEEHRKMVGWMARTLAACRSSDARGMFDMENTVQECSSPMCIAGHGAVQLRLTIKERIELAKSPGEEMDICRSRMGFPIDVDYLRDSQYDNYAMQDDVGWWWFGADLPNAEALRRWEMTLNYRRRQLANLEVEAGEWGRPKPARDMPVGQERERQVLELVGGAA